jgi:regulator of protease activity HflC (stomatin/prohibitin superfamily)
MSWKSIGKSLYKGGADYLKGLDTVYQVAVPAYGAFKQAQAQAKGQDQALEQQQKAQDEATRIAGEQAANNAETLRRAKAKGSRMPELDSYRRSSGGGTLLTGPSGVNTNRVLLGNTNKLGL